jgi:hypothetical protein
MESIQPPEEETLAANSIVANLMQRTASNDGSNDNIIDNSNCFDVQLPVTVIANGIEITVDSESDFDIIEDIFDEYDEDDNTIEIIFPITIILVDFTEVVINSISELNSYSVTCNGENESDDDIECIDFQFPINFSIFNTVTEEINQVTINSNKELHDFIRDLDNDDVANIDFPINVILSDGTIFSTNSLEELEDAIENAIDDCDEDDDFDFNDDDCIDCTPDQLAVLLTGCSDWFVDKLEINDNKLEDNYVGFSFNFFSDGTITVVEGGTNHSGTWTSSGSGLSITVTIDIPTLPDFNADWNLHEIEDQPGEKKVDLRQNNDDRLRFESVCN